MWDLPRPGLEPVSPALAGRFSTTAPPGKPLAVFNGMVTLFILSGSEGVAPGQSGVGGCGGER